MLVFLTSSPTGPLDGSRKVTGLDKKNYFVENLRKYWKPGAKNLMITATPDAYEQNDVLMYPDLIKLKIALDDGEILGMETTGYLNNHYQRTIGNVKITKEQARKNLNKDLDIKTERLAIIPTEWESEILCYEFKGKINDTDYLVYINAETGREEDILVIVNTPNGTMTM